MAGVVIWNLITVIFYIYELLIFARCILSFLPFYNKITEWVFKATEPLLAPCRKLIDRFFHLNIPVDFSPILLLLIMQVLYNVLRSLILIIFF